MRHSGKPARRALAWLVWALLALALALLLVLAALLTTPLSTNCLIPSISTISRGRGAETAR